MKLPSKSLVAKLFGAFLCLVLSAVVAVWLWLPKPSITADIAMSDGVSLRTYVFHPSGEGPWPVVFMRTPYGYTMMTTLFPPQKYTTAGYSFVLQSCRGTGDSGGEYSPFSHARPDAKDTLDWIDSQPFSNDQVGLSGASAMGITANMAASLQHPTVKAAYVAIAPQSSFTEATFMGGVFKEAQVKAWMELQEAEDQVELLRARPVMDDKWRKTDFPDYLSQVNIPILHVGGWYDIFLSGNLANYTYLQEHGAEGAKGKQKLRVGAFGHMGLDGDLAYPEIASEEGAMGKDEFEWFDYWLKGVDNGIVDEPPVEYYIMAAARKENASPLNRVIRTDTWPPAAEPTRFYLQPELGLSTERPNGAAASTEYKFDPKHPVPSTGGANLFLPRGPMDQSVIGDRADYLRFQTPSLTEELTIAGKVEVELYAATDGPDTDFMVKLVDVYPDGYEALLLDAPIRARYRKGRNPEDVIMMTPGVPEKMTIDLWSTANTFEKGHRIAVHVTSSNAPRFEVNPNTGHQPGDSREQTRIATNSIYHSAKKASAIILPILLGVDAHRDSATSSAGDPDPAIQSDLNRASVLKKGDFVPVMMAK